MSNTSKLRERALKAQQRLVRAGVIEAEFTFIEDHFFTTWYEQREPLLFTEKNLIQFEFRVARILRALEKEKKDRTVRIEIRRKDGRNINPIEVVRIIYRCGIDRLGVVVHSLCECRDFDPHDLNSWGSAPRFVLAELEFPEGTDINALQDTEDPDAFSIRVV